MPVSEESMRVLYESITGEEYEGEDLRGALETVRLNWRKEHHPLDRDATRAVSMWICSDSDFYETARMMIRASGVEGLKKYLSGVIRGRGGRPRTPTVIHVSDDLSENDLRRIEWPEIADDLIGD